MHAYIIANICHRIPIWKSRNPKSLKENNLNPKKIFYKILKVIISKCVIVKVSIVHWKYSYLLAFYTKRNPLGTKREASREVANLTWRKNPQLPVYGVKEFVCLSICCSISMSNLINPCQLTSFHIITFTVHSSNMADITFLPGNNYPDLHHLQGGMKFATQISPLLDNNNYLHSALNNLA